MKRLAEYFAGLVKQAELNILEKMEDGRIETETSITDRFLEELENIFEKSYPIEGVKLRARTLRDRGPCAPERKYGADFIAVLDIKLDWIKETKGFLAQSKFEREGRYGDIFIDERLKIQTKKMLEITPDSFIFVYHRRGFYVVPSHIIQNLSSGTIGIIGFEIPIEQFFKNFLICFLGDTRIKAYDDDTLNELRKKVKAREGILFSIEEAKR